MIIRIVITTTTTTQRRRRQYVHRNDAYAMMLQDLDHARYGNAGRQNDFGSRGKVSAGQVGIEEGSDRQSDDHLVICGIVCFVININNIIDISTTICIIIICIILCTCTTPTPPRPGNVLLVPSPHVGPCIIRTRGQQEVARHHPQAR